MTARTKAMAADNESKRMEAAAVEILEQVLMRRNWTTDTRDKLASHLSDLVRKEIKKRT